MIFRVRHLTGFLRKHGHISKRAQERLSSTDSGEIKVLSTGNVVFHFHALTIIPFRYPDDMSSSPLIQISSLRRNNDVFLSVIRINSVFISRHTINRVLSRLVASQSSITWTPRRGSAGSFHRTPKLSYITLDREKDPALQENYASELYQVMIPHRSKVGLTWNQMVSHGRVHFWHSQNLTLLCMKNWGKKDLFQTSWTHFYRLFLKKCPEVILFIH